MRIFIDLNFQTEDQFTTQPATNHRERERYKSGLLTISLGFHNFS